MQQEDNFDNGVPGEGMSDRFFPVGAIKRIKYEDSVAIDATVASKEPFVIEACQLLPTGIIESWRCLEYLSRGFGQAECNVIRRSRDTKFMHWDEAKVKNVRDFEAPTDKLEMNFEQFRKSIGDSAGDGYHYYLQQQLGANVSDEMKKDYAGIDWKWLNRMSAAHFGPLTTNVLFVGQTGHITPCHYDEQDNMFCQIASRKRITLFSPDMFDCLYTFPLFHPCDRQSQTNLFDRTPDISRHPNLTKLRGLTTIVRPGDTVFIPAYWFHEIVSLIDQDQQNTINVSLNFWFQSKECDVDELVYPLSGDLKIAIGRNVEKMALAALKNPNEVKSFFSSLTLGRYS